MYWELWNGLTIIRKLLGNLFIHSNNDDSSNILTLMSLIIRFVIMSFILTGHCMEHFIVWICFGICYVEQKTFFFFNENILLIMHLTFCVMLYSSVGIGIETTNLYVHAQGVLRRCRTMIIEGKDLKAQEAQNDIDIVIQKVIVIVVTDDRI